MNYSQNSLCVFPCTHVSPQTLLLVLNEEVWFVLNNLTGDILLQKYLYKYTQEEI